MTSKEAIEAMKAGQTVVLHSRKKVHKEAKEYALKNGLHVYIGRGDRFDKTAKKSIWHNPYKVEKPEDREGAIKQFEAYLINTPDLINQIASLKGKALFCHCKPDFDCHGDILKKYADKI